MFKLVFNMHTYPVDIIITIDMMEFQKCEQQMFKLNPYSRYIQQTPKIYKRVYIIDKVST